MLQLFYVQPVGPHFWMHSMTVVCITSHHHFMSFMCNDMYVM